MTRDQSLEKGISREEFNHKINFLEVKMEQIERKITEKADEIVSLQVLQHRQELEDIYSAIQKIDEQMDHIDQELLRFEKNRAENERETKKVRTKRNGSKEGKVTPLFT